MRELFVPGRLCLFGEHSDWAAGYGGRGCCLVAGTDQGLRARAERHDAFEIRSRVASGGEYGPERVHDETAGFFSYAAGVAAEVRDRYAVAGLRLSIEADLPEQKGLSSSAAICVLVARAFGEVYGLGLSLEDEMGLAYRGERRAGSECGRMDQICAYGRRPTLLRFEGSGLDVEPLEPRREVSLLIVDLQRGKDTRRILRDLNACFPETPGEVAAGVREALGPTNEALLRRARSLVVEGAAKELGALMTEAQEIFDACIAPACPELRAPRLHEVLEHPAVRELGWGGKGVGSQGDGSAQIVARDAEARDALTRRLESELSVRCLPLTLRSPHS